MARRRRRRRRSASAKEGYIVNYTVGNVSKRCQVTRDEARVWLLKQIKSLGECPFCHTQLSVGKFAVDHMQALNRGGSPALSNCQLTCGPCNRAKGNLNTDEFTSLMEFLNAKDKDMKKIVLARLKIAGSLYKGK